MPNKPDADIIKALNTVLTGELTAINQYFLHSEMCADWGYSRLHKQIRMESIDEMKHADTLIERILFLDGLPNLQDMGSLMIGENTKEMLECDLKLENLAIPDLRSAIAFAEESEDYGTRQVLRSILDSEEDHVDWIEKQLGLIEKIGEQNYIQSQT